ncbi:hypothetical protein BLNAU_21021 [Blattamonas nauphoetae]|uniref:Uncharacterized protein n=1 Tax=Blattamonas nauphoetae TaxID=2049346 RepID=A0ABQ9WX29_9EUKA|nr:hypothetical protein BLNAU_21021 [Blattamonas nauphoetae]
MNYATYVVVGDVCCLLAPTFRFNSPSFFNEGSIEIEISSQLTPYLCSSHTIHPDDSFDSQLTYEQAFNPNDLIASDSSSIRYLPTVTAAQEYPTTTMMVTSAGNRNSLGGRLISMCGLGQSLCHFHPKQCHLGRMLLVAFFRRLRSNIRLRNRIPFGEYFVPFSDDDQN